MAWLATMVRNVQQSYGACCEASEEVKEEMGRFARNTGDRGAVLDAPGAYLVYGVTQKCRDALRLYGTNMMYQVVKLDRVRRKRADKYNVTVWPRESVTDWPNLETLKRRMERMIELQTKPRTRDHADLMHHRLKKEPNIKSCDFVFLLLVV